MRTFKKRSVCATVIAAAFVLTACGKKDKDDDDDDGTNVSAPNSTTTTTESVVAPGAVMLALDNAMGSIAFEGQAASLRLTTNSWIDEHCEEEGDATKSAYDDDMPVKWGCLLAVKTDGPDTPRGGVNRVKQVSCSVDQAITAGTMAIDGLAHTFKAAIDAECWGEAFAQMAAEELPDNVNAATGYAEVDLTVTGYETVPSDWTDNAADWSIGYEVLFGFSADEVMTYRMMLRQDDNFVAASIFSSQEGRRDEVFAMAIEGLGGAEDLANFRYEGRFPYGQNGDGSYGSRHVRVLVSGAYAGTGGFSRIDSASGYEAGMFGDEDTGDIYSGRLSTFQVDESGMGTKDWNVDVAGAISGSVGEDGVSGVNEFTFTATAAELKAFLTEDVATYTEAAAWNKANGPLSYTSVTVGD